MNRGKKQNKTKGFAPVTLTQRHSSNLIMEKPQRNPSQEAANSLKRIRTEHVLGEGLSLIMRTACGPGLAYEPQRENLEVHHWDLW